MKTCLLVPSGESGQGRALSRRSASCPLRSASCSQQHSQAGQQAGRRARACCGSPLHAPQLQGSTANAALCRLQVCSARLLLRLPPLRVELGKGALQHVLHL